MLGLFRSRRQNQKGESQRLAVSQIQNAANKETPQGGPKKLSEREGSSWP